MERLLHHLADGRRRGLASNPQAHAAQASLADDAATAGAPATVQYPRAGRRAACALADELARSLHSAGIATLRSERACSTWARGRAVALPTRAAPR